MKPFSNARFYLIIFLVSLLLRLWFFSLMYSSVDPATWESLSPDVSDYCSSARQIVSDLDFDSAGVQTFGPGYPLFLALLRLLTGSSLVIMMLAQIVVSALVSVLLAWWALRLTNDARVAWVAGGLNALSFTAVSLANIFLSETLFMALIVGGALLLLSALDRSQFTLAILAGLLFGLATLTRSMGVMLPLVMCSLVILGTDQDRTARLRSAGIALAIALIIPLTWSALPAGNGNQVNGAIPSAMARIVRAVDAADSRISMRQATSKFAMECIRHAADSTGDFYASQRQISAQRFQRLLAERPWALSLVIGRNMRDNVINEFGTLASQIPSLANAYESVRIFNARKGLNYRVLLLSMMGGFILLVRRQHRLCIVLMLIFGYFVIISGFSDSQTSRIFYPAQMAWGILVSVTLLAMYDWVMKRWSGRGQRLTN